MYNVGEHVVKPNSGICKIEEVVTMNIDGTGDKQYYVLLPVDNNKAKFYVSTDADRTRIRPVMTKDEARSFIKRIPDIEAVWIINDKLREQQYKEAFRTNEPDDLVSILKNLYQRGQLRMAQGKKITATDERYFKQAEKALYRELAFALEERIDIIEEMITETIER